MEKQEPGAGGYFGDMEVLFLRKDMQIEQSEFCFEYKENAHHQFMLISTLKDHSILIPSRGLTAFLVFLEGFCSGSENNTPKKGSGKPKQLKIDDKVEFLFQVGQNKWGHFLKVQ
ncbi:transcription factor Pur-alpha 1-like [Mangifera indica]|uniref:transcription factor Pur-alpha 1-like n=1 Tax=Mangifera indica TaxID=29780 RepID=UPI001CFB8657|nr:transcription factor Pur-alpha 1-like [Mangifera indica]